MSLPSEGGIWTICSLKKPGIVKKSKLTRMTMDRKVVFHTEQMEFLVHSVEHS